MTWDNVWVGLSVFLAWGCCVQKVQGANDLQTIKTRLMKTLLPENPESQEARTLIKEGRKYASEMKPDGSWQDIDYRNQSSSSWKPAQHIRRLRCMAKTYCLTRRDTGLRTTIHKALDYWVLKKPKARNYWWNAIGVPLGLYPTLFLMEKDLSSSQMKAGLSILGFGYHDGIWEYHGNATGQNLIWIAGIQVYREILRNDADKIAHHVNRIAKEIFVARKGKEGIKADNSFWQHGAILYSGGYGRGFSKDCAQFAWLVHGTRFALPNKKIDLLAAYILDGQIWMCRGDTFDWSARGREIARKSTHAGKGVAKACENMAAIPGARKGEFARAAKEMGENQVGWHGEPSGNRMFWCSDIMVHRRPEYYVSVKMASKRTVGTESGNGENLKGYHLADGCTFILCQGNEYDGIFPVWNWRRIPGITCEQTGKTFPLVDWGRGAKGTTTFVGGVSDGTYGVAAFDFKKAKVRARKAWFGFDQEVVCLGAGIACEGQNPVVTSVNQCLLKGKVTSSRPLPSKGTGSTSPGLTWVHHDGVGYVFSDQAGLNLTSEPQGGSWHDINRRFPKKKETLNVFSLWIDHGTAPKAATYAYRIVPGIKTGSMAGYIKNSGVEVLENTPVLQAVRHIRLQLTGAVFYAPGTLAIGSSPTIAVDQSCVVLVRSLDNKTFSVSLAKPDSENSRSKSVRVTINGKNVVFELPKGEDAGKSLTRKNE